MNIMAFGKAKASEIHELESILKLQLPQDYIKFLMQYNGGTLKGTSYTVFCNDLNENLFVEVFYGFLNTNSAVDIVSTMKEFESDLMEDVIIFARDSANNQFFMVVDGEDKGVYYWDAFYQFESTTDDNTIYFICDTFEEFLNLIKKQ
ncbi:SMI1/KNR4 family protein [Anaeromicropila populeti]|uniref:SMI1 / KNR4 family (SUKH-1) n=1 Tax=Anaeromicropila populeti TaxID=37658 RepID=A0A1I6JWX3_9FIRM|nr:SMI1/KNR4 family protein [Anaeromicropila populeti]SFR83431.1 SMI1 / KNR4 family (SUKH-1) [Anaeromicropila populeti]